VSNELEYITAKPIEDYELPLYSTPGNIYVYYQEANAEYDAEIEVLNYDSDAAPFWIAEGMSFDYWFELQAIDFPETGYYVVENVTGQYIKGDWGFTDDDEKWQYDNIRLMTEEERFLHSFEPRFGM
jgi:hypothetical protein